MLKKHQCQKMLKLCRFQILQFSDWNRIFASKFIKCRSKFVCVLHLVQQDLYILAVSYCPIQLFVCQENNGVFFYESKILIVLFQVPAYIMEALEWLGISPDETIGKMKIWSLPSKRRKPLYRELIN
jgi:hypothetical protein